MYYESTATHGSKKRRMAVETRAVPREGCGWREVISMRPNRLKTAVSDIVDVGVEAAAQEGLFGGAPGCMRGRGVGNTPESRRGRCGIEL
jgi:hypothetical protein